MVPVRDVVLHGDMRWHSVSAARSAGRLRLGPSARVVPLLFVADLVAVLFAVLVAPLTLTAAGWSEAVTPGLGVWLVAAAVAVALAAALSLYGRSRAWHGRTAIWSLLFLVVLTALAGLTGYPAPLAEILVCWAVAVAASVSLRALVDHTVARRLLADPWTRRVLVVGGTIDERRALAQPAEGRRRWRDVMIGAVPLDRLDALEEAVLSERPDAVILLDHEVPGDDLTALLDVTRRTRVHLQVRADDLGDDPVCLLAGTPQAVFLVRPSVARSLSYLVKRVFDVVVAALLLVLLSPLFLVVAVITKIGSPGPAFYVSWRMGVGEEPFPCFKFRTMVDGADVQQEELESRNEADGVLFKIRDDPRITPVGRFLRRTSLDELPQLINVLAGQMSLVGPRPLPLRDVERMEDRFKARYAVLPGMTGLWQVEGRSRLGSSDMLDLDLKYVRTWSLGTDWRILWRTVGVVLKGKGAY